MTTMGKRIARKRKELGLQQTDLAEKLGLARQTVSMWETGTISDLRGKNLHKLAEILQVSEDWILFGGDDPPEVSTGSDDEIIKEICALVKRLPRDELQKILYVIREREEHARKMYEELRRRFEKP